MNTVYGLSTTYDRIAKDSMTPNNQVALDHDYYSANPEASKKKMAEVSEAKKASGMEVGYSGKMEESGKDYPKKRSPYAMGGVAKLRMDYPGA